MTDRSTDRPPALTPATPAPDSVPTQHLPPPDVSAAYARLRDEAVAADDRAQALWATMTPAQRAAVPCIVPRPAPRPPVPASRRLLCPPGAPADTRPQDTRALIVHGPRHTCALECLGDVLTWEIDEEGLDAGELFPAPPAVGLWVWEGTYVWCPPGIEETHGEWDARGSFRPLTAVESQALRTRGWLWHEPAPRSTEVP